MAAAFTAASLSFTPAIAAGDEQQRTAGVSYADLDLATEEGITQLDNRIDRAARRVCDYNRPETGTRIRNTDTRVCYLQAKRSFEVRFAAIIRDAQLGG